VAWLFELAVECGEDRDAAEEFAAFFDGKRKRLTDGFVSSISTSPEASVWQEPGGGPWWVRVVPSGMGQSGILPQNERRSEECSAWLYALLRKAPDFRIALVGVEVEEFRTVDHLEGPDDLVPGMVVSRAIWLDMHMPRMAEFRDGYLWSPRRRVQ
jgi:hypothetical protein